MPCQQDFPGVDYWEVMTSPISQSTTRMRPDAHHHSPSQDQPRRRSWGWNQGVIGPHQGKAAKPGPLDVAKLDHVNGSPSRTWDQHLKKTKQLGSPPWTSILGPHWSWGQTSSASYRSWPPCWKREKRVIPCRNSQQKSTKSGLHGWDVGSTHLTCGGSCWESQG